MNKMMIEINKTVEINIVYNKIVIIHDNILLILKYYKDFHNMIL